MLFEQLAHSCEGQKTARDKEVVPVMPELSRDTVHGNRWGKGIHSLPAEGRIRCNTSIACSAGEDDVFAGPGVGEDSIEADGCLTFNLYPC